MTTPYGARNTNKAVKIVGKTGTRTDLAVTEEPQVDLLMSEIADLTGEVRQR